MGMSQLGSVYLIASISGHGMGRYLRVHSTSAIWSVFRNGVESTIKP
jgi:hypothetical protein